MGGCAFRAFLCQFDCGERFNYSRSSDHQCHGGLCFCAASFSGPGQAVFWLFGYDDDSGGSHDDPCFYLTSSSGLDRQL